VTPVHVSAHELGQALRHAHELVESITLFDVFRGSSLPEGTRSVTYAVRLSAPDRTLNETEVTEARAALLAAAQTLSATLR
jgi:phenylalanyl-tRNA synthetase beta chain